MERERVGTEMGWNQRIGSPGDGRVGEGKESVRGKCSVSGEVTEAVSSKRGGPRIEKEKGRR